MLRAGATAPYIKLRTHNVRRYLGLLLLVAAAVTVVLPFAMLSL